MTRVVALVQARMGSTRFPGKMLADLGGHPLLEWVLKRVSCAQLIDTVVLATTTLSRDDDLVALATKLGVAVYRGSETDVLGRFAAAADQYGADIVVRICADNPFIDAGEIDRLVSYFNDQPCDYACNHQDRLGCRYADGFGAEILSSSLLQQIAQTATEDKHREHATLYIWDHPSQYCLRAVPAPSSLAYPQLRFDVDQLRDLTYLQKLTNAGVNIDSTASQITQAALSCNRVTLVTTDLRVGPPISIDSTYFLGAWCFACRHDEKHARDSGRILDFHWNDRNKLKDDFDRLGVLKEELLDELFVILNKIHGLNEGKKYWHLLLGYWLNIYTSVMFDRWSSLEQAVKTGHDWQSYVLQHRDEAIVAADTSDFIYRASESSQWNHAVFALLIQYLPEIGLINIDGASDLIARRPLNERKYYSAKKYVKAVFGSLADRFKRNDRLFLINTYIPKKNLMKLEIALGQIPLFHHTPEWNTTSHFDGARRNWSMPIGSNKIGFDLIVRELLPKFIPIVFIEGFQELVSKANKLNWPKSPKVIFTSNSHFTDDLFKAWAARCVSSGARLIVGEHGGMGVGLFNGAHRYEVSIADTYLSTGWKDSNKKNIIPLGNSRYRSIKVNANPCGNALLVCGNMPRYGFDIRSMMLSSQVLDYFNDQFRFIDALTNNVREEIRVRLYQSDYGWEQKSRWLDRYPSILLDDGNLPMWKVASQCRLFIGTYNATTYIEALSQNFPTVMFWNPSHWEVKPEAQPFFDKLRDAGIFHESPESAAKHVSRIWNDIPGWWQSETVQVARESFCDAYAVSLPDLIGRLKKILVDEAKRSTICVVK